MPEDADLARVAKAVLICAQKLQRSALVRAENQNAVGRVLRLFGTSQLAGLCKLIDEHGSNAQVLAHVVQSDSSLARLRHATHLTLRLGRGDHLQRVKNKKRRSHRLQVPQNHTQVVFVGDQNVIVHRVQARSAIIHLLLALLARHIQNSPILAHCLTDVGEKRRLTCTRGSTQQARHALNETAANNTVKLLDTRWDALRAT